LSIYLRKDRYKSKEAQTEEAGVHAHSTVKLLLLFY